jgi:hypothetical protein
MRKKMQAETSFSEPYRIGERLYRALQSKALKLEVDALGDELVMCSMENADQLRRQRLLIQAQRDEAERFRDFLTRTIVRPDRFREARAKESLSG